MARILLQELPKSQPLGHMHLLRGRQRNAALKGGEEGGDAIRGGYGSKNGVVRRVNHTIESGFDQDDGCHISHLFFPELLT
jgi:hypothetical protein